MAITLDLEIQAILSYKRLSYDAWHAFAEFVDNSTQSYFNNRETLDALFSKTKERLEVSIVYDRDEEFIREIEIQTAVSEFQDELSSNELVDILGIEPGPPDVAAQALKPLKDSIEYRDPKLRWASRHRRRRRLSGH